MFRRLAALAVLTGVMILTVAGCDNPGHAPEPAADSGLVAHTDSGAVRGTLDGDVRRFQGIPYAQAPIDTLRWAPPQPPAPWPGVRDAVQPGPRCPQTASDPGAAANTNEDCLSVNVTTPAHGGIGLPVMVWLHGGESTGSGADYDPVRLVSTGDVVVVTANFRLGAFASLAPPQLGSGGGDFGLQDQLAILRWVKDNATGFGGDPGNVTLFGESSGAFATCTLISMPQTAGLVDKAIMESSSCSAFFPKNALAPGLARHTLFTPLSQAQTESTTAADQLGCGQAPDVLACLRKTPVKAWLDGGYMDLFSTTTYGTDTLPQSPELAMREGRTLPIPVLFGINRDELRLYVGAGLAAGGTFDDATYHRLLQDTYGSAADSVAAAYPPPDTTQYGAALAWAAATTDDGWSCPTVADAQALSGHGQTVYGYVFADDQAPNALGYPVPPGFPLGAAHGLELASLFGPATGTPAQRDLAQTMVAYWTNFARTGNPNGPGLPEWPRFDGRMQRMAPGDIAPVDQTQPSHCTLWHAVSP